MRLMVVLLVALTCFGQGKQNVIQTGIVDARGANWIPPTSTFASPPSSPLAGSVYIFTDATATGTCSGGGSAFAVCRWSGTAWDVLSGGAGTASYSCAVSAASSVVCTHNLGTSRPWVACYDGGGNLLGGMGATTSVISVAATSANAVTLTFSAPTTATCSISTGSMGPAGPTGATGAAGSGSGDASTNTATSVDNEIALFSGANGKMLKRASGTGYVKVESGVMTASASIPITDLPASVQTESKCFDLGSDNSSADLADADIGPQGRIFMVPAAATVIEIGVAANAGTPKVIVQKLHGSSATDLLSGTLATGAAGAVACAATGAACLDGTAKSGTVSIVTAGSANMLAAGDWIQTKAGTGLASTGAKRLSVCVTYAR